MFCEPWRLIRGKKARALSLLYNCPFWTVHRFPLCMERVPEPKAAGGTAPPESLSSKTGPKKHGGSEGSFLFRKPKWLAGPENRRFSSFKSMGPCDFSNAAHFHWLQGRACKDVTLSAIGLKKNPAEVMLVAVRPTRSTRAREITWTGGYPARMGQTSQGWCLLRLLISLEERLGNKGAACEIPRCFPGLRADDAGAEGTGHQEEMGTVGQIMRQMVIGSVAELREQPRLLETEL